MKNVGQLIKILTLCITLVMIAGIAKGGDSKVSNLTITSQSASVTYGTTKSVTFLMTVTVTGGNTNGTSLLSISNLPTGATATFSSASITNGNTLNMPANSDASISVTITITNDVTANASTSTFTVRAPSSPNKTVDGIYTISPAILTVSEVSVNSKVYDGFTTATISGGILSGIKNLDNVTLSTTGTFSDKNVGDGKTVNCTLAGTRAGNYTLTQPGLTANITTKSLSVTGTFTTQNKTYNGNTTATVSVTGLTWVGLVSGDVVSLAYNFADKNVGTGKTITCSIIGTDASNYSFTPPSLISRTITPKTLTVPNAAVASKVYDRTTAATITGTLTGVISGDAVTLVGTGTFASATVGTKAVTASCTLSGTDAGNYSLTQPTSLTGTITPLALTVPNAAVTSKVYDRTTAATITGTLTGVIPDDVVTLVGSGTFASANVANGISVTSSSTLSGANAGNYSLTPLTGLKGSITAKSLTVSSPAVTSKVYDRTTAATITGTLTGVISPDAVTLVGTGTFAGTNVANGISVTSSSTLSGANAGNYSLTPLTGLTGNITPKTLTVTGATVATKVYDGTTTATVTGGSLQGVISPDVVDLTQAGTFSSPDVGTVISVTSNCSISGTDAGNYSLTQPTGLTGAITAPTTVSWNGTTSTDWALATNWTPPYLPDATVDVTIPTTTNKPVINTLTAAACNNLTINTSAGLTIQPKGSLTVTGNLTNSAGAAGLSLISDVTAGNVENGTGSLIVIGLASGDATLTRAMKSGAYHLVTSPLGGQSINSFLTNTVNANTIQTGSFEYRSMRDYNPTANDWNDFFKDNTSGQVVPGTGYSIRVRTSQAHNVVFTGTLPNGDISLTGLVGGYWNCIGNPYTSAITINSSGEAATRFLENNKDNLDPAYVSVYVWDPALDALNYIAKSNATEAYNLQQGQAFMVRMAPLKNSVSFNKTMQVHDVALELKSTDNIWPTINLIATADSSNSSTIIAFHDGMTNGLDVSYDAGLLKAGSPIDLYTRLVDDYGIPFAIQALPSDQYEQLIIPVGVDYTSGGTVSFSAKSVYLPASCRPILEDRLLGIMTDLSDTTYTADLTANTAGTGRFYLHTSYASTRAVNRDKALGLSAWAVGNHEININGQINNGATASIFDVQGRLIDTYVLREGRSNRISLPSVNPGIYLLQVRDAQTLQVVKIIVCK